YSSRDLAHAGLRGDALRRPSRFGPPTRGLCALHPAPPPSSYRMRADHAAPPALQKAGRFGETPHGACCSLATVRCGRETSTHPAPAAVRRNRKGKKQEGAWRADTQEGLFFSWVSFAKQTNTFQTNRADLEYTERLIQDDTFAKVVPITYKGTVHAVAEMAIVSRETQAGS